MCWRDVGIGSPFVAVSILLLVCGCEQSSSRAAFLHWEIRSALEIPGGPTSASLTVGALQPFAAEEIALLAEAERRACREYQRADAMQRFSTSGGRSWTTSIAGYSLSWSQARLAWARGYANETLSRLQQANKFSEKCLEDYRSEFRTDVRDGDRFGAIVEAPLKGKMALERVRRALKQLRVMTDDAPKQIDPWSGIIDDNCQGD